MKGVPIPILYKGYFILAYEEMFQKRMSIVCIPSGGTITYKGAKP
jgi:hypothetical protein